MNDPQPGSYGVVDLRGMRQGNGPEIRSCRSFRNVVTYAAAEDMTVWVVSRPNRRQPPCWTSWTTLPSGSRQSQRTAFLNSHSASAGLT